MKDIEKKREKSRPKTSTQSRAVVNINDVVKNSNISNNTILKEKKNIRSKSPIEKKV
jgi:hypothetical protein